VAAKQELLKKIEDRTVVGAVIGLGYVGLPLVQHLCLAGYKVLGFDVDATKIEQLLAGESYIEHLDSETISKEIADGQFDPTDDFSRLAEADCISICVPTPLDTGGGPDLSYVEQTAEAIAKTLRAGQLIILESTTYPGTTDEVLRPVLEAGGLKAGVDFFLAYSPEREDPGNPKYSISTIPKVTGGITPDCNEIAGAYYSRIFESIISVSTPAAAEMTKLLENIFRSVNIALVNELKLLCERMDIDVWEVIDAAGTKPFGFMPFYPGPGLGGHCIPIDPFYLSWRARQFDFHTRFIELAGEVNTSMPSHVIRRVAQALNHAGKALKNADVIVLGVAYKKNVDDTRESPALKLIELLLLEGAKAAYSDPHVPNLPKSRRYDFGLSSEELTAERLGACDCVLVATDHDGFDFDFIAAHAPIIVDTRNATRNVTVNRDRIVRA